MRIMNFTKYFICTIKYDVKLISFVINMSKIKEPHTDYDRSHRLGGTQVFYARSAKILG